MNLLGYFLKRFYPHTFLKLFIPETFSFWSFVVLKLYLLEPFPSWRSVFLNLYLPVCFPEALSSWSFIILKPYLLKPLPSWTFVILKFCHPWSFVFLNLYWNSFWSFIFFMLYLSESFLKFYHPEAFSSCLPFWSFIFLNLYLPGSFLKLCHTESFLKLCHTGAFSPWIFIILKFYLPVYLNELPPITLVCDRRLSRSRWVVRSLSFTFLSEIFVTCKRLYILLKWNHNLKSLPFNFFISECSNLLTSGDLQPRGFLVLVSFP